MAICRIFSLGWILTATLGAEGNEAGRWQGSGNVGVTLATGNSESLRATAGLEVSRTLGKWETQVALAATYGADGGVSSTERLKAELQLNREFSGRFYAGLNKELLHDPPAGIGWRLALTPLLGWRAADGEKIKLRLEAGPGFTWQDRSGEAGEFSSVRLHERMSYQVTDDIRLFQSLTALFEAEDLDHFTISAEAGVESRLSGLWSLRLTANAVYYGAGQETEDKDLLLTAGFGYNHLPADLKQGSLKSALDQLEVEAGRWRITGLLGGSLSEGNSEARAVHAGLELKRKTPRDEFAAGVFGSYGETEGVTSSGALSADAHYQRQYGGKGFMGLRGDFDHDALADLGWRIALTPYGGRHLVKTKRIQLSMEAGPSAVMEEQGGSGASYLAGYLAAKGEYGLGEKTRLFGDLSWLAEASDWSSFLVTSEAGIDHALSDRLSVRLIARNTYDSSPARGRGRYDFQLVSALGLTF